METAIQHIQSLGFTANEAKAYIALLTCQPASAYEVARTAAIPTSKIYETVNKLVAKGVFRQISDGQNQVYSALPIADFLARAEEQTREQLSALKPLLQELDQRPNQELIWPIADEAGIRAKAISIVRESKDTLLLSAWPEELDWLEEALRAAEDRGIRVAFVHFGKPRMEIGSTYHHPVEKTLYQEKGGRGLTLVADQAIVLIANYLDRGGIDASWSRNASFVTVAEDYIKHDVYITKVTRFLDSEMKQRFGSEYERLRDVFDAEA